MQQRSGERDLVEAEVGHDLGDRHRVVDVALAAAAQLVPVRLLRRLVGAVDHCDRRLRMAPAIRREQRCQFLGGRVLVATPGQDTIDSSHQYLARLSTR